jgi:hypothetical protein
MQPCYKDLAWSVPSPDSYGLDELFQSYENSGPALHDIVDLSSQTHQSVGLSGDRSFNSPCPLTSKRDLKALDSVSDSLPSPKKARMIPEYRDIAPKQNNHSAEVVESVGSKNIVRRGIKKGGRQGSLNPEKKQKATEMRGVRACAICYISHVEVRFKSFSYGSMLIKNKSVPKVLFVASAKKEMRKVRSNHKVV